jgi:Ca2+-binding EF-hand superfamily protein
VFDEFDVDKSDTMDTEEFQVLLRELAIPMTLEEVQSINSAL